MMVKRKATKSNSIKHRFTKLEILLISFVSLIVFGLFIYIKSSNFNIVSLFDKKAALQQRYRRFNYLLENLDYGSYYDEFLMQEYKKKTTREEYINRPRETPKSKKRIITTHSITIRDNIAYIDRTLTECKDEDCIDNIEKRIYKKWEFKEGNWYPAGEEYCIRDAPYDMPPEFERALSLIKQRQDQWDQKDGTDFGDWQWMNCLDIQYTSIPDAEGYFAFDQNSTADRLTVFVDNSYKIKDDLVTALLLSHELNHVVNFITSLEEGTKQSCYDAEITAFVSQINFLRTINKEEISSIGARLNLLPDNVNSPLQIVKTFSLFMDYADRGCSKDARYVQCYWGSMQDQISQMVKSNPYYQKQCANQ